MIVLNNIKIKYFKRPPVKQSTNFKCCGSCKYASHSGAYIVTQGTHAQAYLDAIGADAGLSAATRAVVGAGQRRRPARAVDRCCTGAVRALIRTICSVPALPY